MKRQVLVGLAVVVVSACSGIPLMPKWDADWRIPLASQTTKAMFGSKNVSISPGISMPLALKAQKVALDPQLLAILPRLQDARIVFTIDKSFDVSGTYAVHLASDSASLAASGAAMQFAVSAADRNRTDSVTVSVAGMQMIQQTAGAGGTLWVQVRGRTSFTGPGNLTITPTDSIGVHAALLLTIAVSR